jgi:hypothetical protein
MSGFLSKIGYDTTEAALADIKPFIKAIVDELAGVLNLQSSKLTDLIIGPKDGLYAHLDGLEVELTIPAITIGGKPLGAKLHVALPKPKA